MTGPATEEWEEDGDALPPWADATEYSTAAPMGTGFWGGVPSRQGEGAMRGWWIRSLAIAAKQYVPQAEAAVLARMVMWLVEAGAPTGYITFITDERYQPGSAGGYWRIQQDALAADLPKAFAWAAATIGSTQTIDELLAAPLAFVKVAQPEPCGVDLLRQRGDGEAAVHRFYRARNAVRNHWPRDCATCGSQFRPARRNRINCAECLAARRKTAAR